MGTIIIYNGKRLAFRCNKKRPCKRTFCGEGFCEHTTDIEHAIFDGEKVFRSASAHSIFEEQKS